MLHEEVELLIGLEGVVHVHDEGRGYLGQNLPLVHDLLDAVPRQYIALLDDLHRVLLTTARACFLHEPDLAKATLAELLQDLEVAEGHGLTAVLRKDALSALSAVEYRGGGPTVGGWSFAEIVAHMSKKTFTRIKNY